MPFTTGFLPSITAKLQMLKKSQWKVNIIRTFDGVIFKGQFRPYQQRVLDSLESHHADNKIHIVAAPGSGKTILGLEVMRYLGAPALVLSPTVIIQQQWGQRFEELFLPDGAEAQEYLSYDLHSPALITSLTYQGLYAAWNRLAENVADAEADGRLDYQGFDLLDTIRKAGIRTICLDEAHHLKDAWQHALDAFVAAVKSEVSIIALTATPPYDSTPAQWARYHSLCGDIDEEISAPTLVQQGILCPHQDFIYFNRPTRDEESAMIDFRHRAHLCVQEVLDGAMLADMLVKGHVLDETGTWSDWRVFNTKGVQALLVLAAHKGFDIPETIANDMFLKGHVPAYKQEYAQTAFQFILDNPDTFGAELTGALHKKLARAGVMVRKKVCLTTDARLNRRLTASCAKLESIGAIAAAEQLNLGEKLRLLVLTDFVGKDQLPVAGSSGPLSGLDAVSVFETLRRSLAYGTPLAVLTGSLVILPGAALPALQDLCAAGNIACHTRPLREVDFHEVTFGSGNRQKVALLTQLFQAGHIHAMVGTKSLLGEGWDSPCINSLVLASYVGSFVLSNQMRGRAIRKDPNAPGKVSNIWHLVTVMPSLQLEGGLREPVESEDFALLSRRFECFMGPSYQGGTIESGIGRIDIIRHPPDQMDTNGLNRQMLELAADRPRTASGWNAALPLEATPEVLEVTDVPFEAVPPRFVFANVLHASSLAAGLGVVIGFIWNIPHFFWNWKGYLIAGAACLAATGLLLRSYYLLLRVLSPKRYIKSLARSLLATLKELGEINSGAVAFEMEHDTYGIGCHCALAGGTLREKKLFATALEELLSPFDSPRYLIVKQQRILFWHRDDYTKSYACPAVIAGHRKRIEVFQKHLGKNAGRFRLLFTGSARQELLKGLKHSYINKNGVYIESKRLVRRAYNAKSIMAGTKNKALERAKAFVRSLLP